jgi:hypothetical protein
MLGNLFKPKWQHSDAKVRIQSLTSLAGDSVELIKLAQTDPHSAVRMEATVRLTHLPTLVQLGHAPGSIGERARQRVIVLAATDHHHDHLLADVFHWLNNPALLRSIARDPLRGVKLRHQAIATIKDQELLFSIAHQETSKEIQYLAASHISDLDKLQTLEKNHGKTNKRLRQLLKERMEREQRHQQQQADIEKLCEEAQVLGKTGTWGQAKTQARILQQRWGQHAGKANPEQQQRFNMAQEDFQQRLSLYEAEQAAIAIEQAQLAEAQANQQAAVQQLAEQAAQVEREQQEQQQQVQATARQQRQQQQELQQAQQAESMQQLRAALQTLESSLETEQYGEAIDQHQALIRHLKNTPGLPAKEREFFQRRIQTLAPVIRELQDWRRWGTDQVRKQLIETADHLREDDILDPQERAKQVQTLRNEWRKLAAMEPGQQRALWKTFDSTVTAAYEPSKQHFVEQAQQRQANLEQRQTVCAELENLNTTTDWENPGWRAQQAQINLLRKQWKETGTVGHKDWKIINERFNAAMDALEVHFKAERTRNWQEREQLVAQANELLSLEDTATAIQQAKQLQTQWYITLASRPSDEQRLWKQFREPIDALFARAREERDQQHQEHENQKTELVRQEEEKRLRQQRRQQEKMAELDILAEQSTVNKQADADTETLAINQRTGEMLCLQLEILLELETPAAFQQARMAYQVAQLQDAMRSRKDDSSPLEQALPLLKQWYALGAMAADAAHEQATRIQAIRTVFMLML